MVDAKESKRYQTSAALNELIDLAQSVLDGKHNSARDILQVADMLLTLAGQAEVSDGPPFTDLTLYAILDDCDCLPISDDFRQKCSQQYLEESEPEIRSLSEHADPVLKAYCAQVLDRYGKADLDALEAQIMIDEFEP